MSKSNLKIVLDTNVFLVSIASNHRYSWIYDALFPPLRVLKYSEFEGEYKGGIIG